ncbi:hypothetical protein Skr01_00620 [Sphaerisporangium krabiense]|uniref:DUF308 domain-containing protein n=1 Tax=Sphaerisporangium krabiense TaxID=763782 RepID=A0A7W9DS45_9ACTN|nr:hypothetical protein [Sphaerisporangium krabiense]MBB5629181.1 hypothetical protein [Sphaerisporangium krabiense]GII59977.1 hypothetical protein Skr01_00620 [Sphaerisporangium krabiense]
MTPQSDEDEVWRQIVASFNETAEAPSAAQPWPDRENVPAEDAPQAVTARPPVEAREETGDERPLAPPEDDDDHYIPPPPPPLPKMDPGTKIAWLALFGGPAYLLLAALLTWPMDGWIIFAAIAAFIGGFVALIVRMGDGPPPDSGWDDGAVI